MGDRRFQDEWCYNRGDKQGPPRIGVALSGGGTRSAAFAIGVLRRLHQRGRLTEVDIISAVSGGSYALSWLLRQPYGEGDLPTTPSELAATYDRMFAPEGDHQRRLEDNARLFACDAPDKDDWHNHHLRVALTVLATLITSPIRVMYWLDRLGHGLAARLEQLLRDEDPRPRRYRDAPAQRSYRQSLECTFQVPPPRASAQPVEPELTVAKLYGEGGSLKLVSSRVSHAEIRRTIPPLPFYIFNATVGRKCPFGRKHLGRGSCRLTHGVEESVFELTPLGYGSGATGYGEWSEPSTEERFWLIELLNLAPAISGAALSASHLLSWPLVRLADLDLGYFVPRLSGFNGNRGFYLSDGGHAENLGVYSLLCRRCQHILVVDAEHDRRYGFEAYTRLKEEVGRLTMKLAVDEIDHLIDDRQGSSAAPKPVFVGHVRDENDKLVSEIWYLKLSLDRQRLESYPPAVRCYADGSKPFPQESTVDQDYGPLQFAAYRELGYHLAGQLGGPFRAHG